MPVVFLSVHLGTKKAFESDLVDRRIMEMVMKLFDLGIVHAWYQSRG